MNIRFYETPKTLPEEINAFENTIKEFKAGNIHPTKFKGIRVAFGIYEQRKEDTYMVRIRCAAGGITPAQILKAAELGELYGRELVHVTTRQEIQLHYVDLKNVPTVMRELLKVGLSTRGGGGNTVRNIMSSYDSGVNPIEEFDVEPHAIALTTRMLLEPDSWNLPRKFKMTFSSSKDDNANATLQCVGFFAKFKEDKKGFEVWVAGGMGAKSRVGKLFIDWIPEDEVYHTVKSIKNLFHKNGNRRNKHHSRLRFLWDDLGEDVFRTKYQEERNLIGDAPELALNLIPINNQSPAIDVTPFLVPDSLKETFESWKLRYVTAQKQEDLSSIRIPLILGDLYTKDAKVLAKVLEPFGENLLRCSMDQNLHIRNIPYIYLGNIFKALSEMTNLVDRPKLYSNMIACTGADTCKLGICLPRGVTPVIQKKFSKNKHLNLDQLNDIKIHISGCPNSCGQHHVGDIGFHGKVRRIEGRAFPSYNVLGGAIINRNETRFGEITSWVHARDLPATLEDILENFQNKKDQFADFADYFDHGGKEEIETVCKNYNENIPDYGEDKNYYYDWGAEDVFSTKGMGQGECSAGMFDMIEVDVRSIRSHKTLIGTNESKDEINTALYDIVFHASRMLLVTRGIDAQNDKEVFDQFDRAFFETRLADQKFRPLIQAAKTKDETILASKEELIIEFGDFMIKLYKSMDNSMKFPGESEVMALQIKPDKSAAVNQNISGMKTPEKSKDRFKNYRGVACPMNFIKTKIDLAPMKSGEILEILLDDGEPIDNVPKSVASEGHKILEQTKIDNHWSVVIEKV